MALDATSGSSSPPRLMIVTTSGAAHNGSARAMLAAGDRRESVVSAADALSVFVSSEPTTIVTTARLMQRQYRSVGRNDRHPRDPPGRSPIAAAAIHMPSATPIRYRASTVSLSDNQPEDPASDGAADQHSGSGL